MTALAAVVLVLVVVAIAGGRWVASRRRDDRSIESHRSTLEVIEHVAGADTAPARGPDQATKHVRIVDAPASRLPRPALDTEVVPAAVPERRTDRPSFPRPKDHTLHPPEVPAAVVPLASARSEPSAARRPTHYRTPAVLAAAAVALLMAAITGVALGSQGHGPHHRPSPARVAAGSSHPTSPNPPAPAPRSTTRPPVPAVVVTKATSAYATYTVNATTLDVSLTTAGPCWVELRSGNASGPLVYQGTLPAGANQSFHLVGPIWLRLGDPAGVKLSIDGSPVALPATSSPFDVAVTVPAGA